MSIDVPTNTVSVYWKGVVPSPVAASMRAAHVQHNIQVALLPAAYSQAELAAAQQRLVATFIRQGRRFSSVGPALDASGLDLQLPAAPGETPLAAASVEQAYQQALGGVPVSVSASSQPRLADRYSDTAPFWGGDYMQSGTTACSSGFPVQNANKETFLLSASHCSPTGTGTWTTGASTTIGSDAGWASSDDAMIIGTTANQGFLYTGSSLENPNGQSDIPVNGAGDPTVGELDCASGSFSDSICSIKVIKTNMSIQTCEGTKCTTYSQEVQAEQQSHLDAAGNGDSGGPVYTPINNHANARGTLTAIDSTNASATCTGVPAGNGRSCSWRIFFPDVLGELRDFGVSVISEP
jgi:hypothetical protein